MLDVAAPPHASPSMPPAVQSLAAQGFMLATGIENSAPVVAGGRRRD